jgi:hypothetical protein
MNITTPNSCDQDDSLKKLFYLVVCWPFFLFFVPPLVL